MEEEKQPIEKIKVVKSTAPEGVEEIKEGDIMKKKILVVDDTFDDLITMKKILEKEGYEVATATNGAQALDLLTEDGVNLILIDIKMPTLSGYDLLRLLRERLNHKSKMVYVSIVPKQDVDMEDIDGFLQKPFNPEDLIDTVKKVLKKNKKKLRCIEHE